MVCSMVYFMASFVRTPSWPGSCVAASGTLRWGGSRAILPWLKLQLCFLCLAQEGLRYLFQTESKYVCLMSGTGHAGAGAALTCSCTYVNLIIL